LNKVIKDSFFKQWQDSFVFLYFFVVNGGHVVQILFKNLKLMATY